MDILSETDPVDGLASQPNDVYQQTWLQLLRYTKALEQEMSNRFRKHFKQSLTRFDLLTQLAEKDPQWMAIGKLAQQLLASNGNITGLVDRMTAEGLIERRHRSRDRRSVEVGLTDNGRALHRQMATAHTAWAHVLMSERLPVEKAEQLRSLLTRDNGAFY